MCKESRFPVNRLGLVHVLLRVNRRGFFYPLVLLSLFDRSRGGDYRLIQHFKIERVHQDASPEVERNVTATKRAPRLFMVAPKTKHGPPAKKAANSAAAHRKSRP
jgi:hypothetical protein